ncbi:aldo/keto reductase [Catenovulum sp. SM1970]|uniref:aldo/keto reductase n=1 Tax=Marinifaba aquimaris TaxID=2741323 RepID=UPI001572EE43|nr:aldo/keto reductase [Marinifaba aquimaris]NTS75709.1 aldo/keto reductase [Marinifaba aquimaris]
MITLPIHSHFTKASRLIYGCMGLGGSWDTAPINKEHIKQGHDVVDAVLEMGINIFDHADIYTWGKAEQVFAKVLEQRPTLRDHITLQSKCAIRFKSENLPGRYDFSESWIKQSVEGILSRLGIEQLDCLLLHRPDPLMQVEEVAETFRTLKNQGKVKHFGVSNMHRYQMDLLNHYLDEPLIANQIELNLHQLDWLNEGVEAGTPDSANAGFNSGTLEYCKRHNIQVQSWGALAQGLYSGRDVSNKPQAVQQTAQLVQALSEQYSTTAESIVLAWLMRHPVHIQPIIGSTNIERIKACADAERVSAELTRDDWYRLFVSSRGRILP